MTTPHRRTTLDRYLSQVEADIVRMSSMVEMAIEQAMKALSTHALDLATMVSVNDEDINHLRYGIEEECLRILATQQPAAGDLRAVLAASHIAGELERIGDYAANIADLVEKIGPIDAASPVTEELPKMAKRARKMLRMALDAYISRNAELAHAVYPRDEKLNERYKKLFDVVTAYMRDDEMIEQGTHLIWIGHHLERIGDRTINIAERVIFMCTGKFLELKD
jgi:phosphate transport system protein